MIIKGREPVLKRLPTRIDRTEGIQTYDSDNRYPQRAKETMYRSYTLNGIIEKLSGFLNGEGFVDEQLNTIVVNDEGLTMRELLDFVCSEKSWINGYALHINYNLNYTIASITEIPFEYCRFGLPDKNGNIDTIAYSTNWERDYDKEGKTRVIEYYPVFNPSSVMEEAELVGGIQNHKGQILYRTKQKNQYPKATFDSVFEHAQTQAEIAVYALSNVVNGFTAGHIFLYPGKFENDTEAHAFKKRMQDHKGAMGANSMMIIEAGSGDIKGDNLLLKTDQQNNDKLFEFTLNWIEKAMLQCYGMPSEIIGKLPDTGLFNKQQIEDAYTYFNAVTRDVRTEISQDFKKLFQFWSTPIQSEFIIKAQVYDMQQAAAAVQVETSAIDTIIRSLSRRDVSKIYSYVNDFKNGRATIEQTKAFLKTFLQTDENVNLFIQDPEGDG